MMNWGRNRRGKSAAKGREWLLATASACLITGGAAHAQDVRRQPAPLRGKQPAPLRTDPRSVIIVPRVSAMAGYTDNVAVDSAIKKSSPFVRGGLGGEITVNTQRLKADLDGIVHYDAYSHGGTPKGASWQALGSSSYGIINQALTLDANGTVFATGRSTTVGSVQDRAGVTDLVQVATVSIGPRLTTTLGDAADLNASARVGYVSYWAVDSSASQLPLPNDGAVFNTAIGADTGLRRTKLRLTAYAAYTRSQEQHFESGSGIASAYVKVFPNLRLIARGGYEDIVQPGVLDIREAVWSAGAELRFGGKSTVSVERGKRYGRNVWNSDLQIEVLNHLLVSARYNEGLTTSEGLLDESFQQFVGRNGALPAIFQTSNYQGAGNLNSNTFFLKSASADIVYIWPTQRLEISISQSNQTFLDAPGRDKTIDASLAYSRTIRPDLLFDVVADYGKTYSSTRFVDGERYNILAIVSYKLNPTVTLGFGGGHFTGQSQIVGRGRTSENTGFLSIEKRFK